LILQCTRKDNLFNSHRFFIQILIS
jgi:hypothetical protein